MQVLAEPRDGVHGGICNPTAFCQHKVSEARGHIYDLFNRPVRQLLAGRKIENAEMFVSSVAREGQEGRVVDQVAAGEPQFAEGLALG